MELAWVTLESGRKEVRRGWFVGSTGEVGRRLERLQPEFWYSIKDKPMGLDLGEQRDRKRSAKSHIFHCDGGYKNLYVEINCIALHIQMCTYIKTNIF